MEQNSNSLSTISDAVPAAEQRPILLRAYAQVPYEKQRSRAPGSPKWALVFDTETTPDETQRLRFGVYQLLHNGRLEEKVSFTTTSRMLNLRP